MSAEFSRRPDQSKGIRFLTHQLRTDPPESFCGPDGLYPLFNGSEFLNQEGNLFSVFAMNSRANQLRYEALFKGQGEIVKTKKKEKHFGREYKTRTEEILHEGVLLSKTVDYSSTFPWVGRGHIKPYRAIGLYGLRPEGTSYGGEAFGLEVTQYHIGNDEVNLYKIMEGKDQETDSFSIEDVVNGERTFSNVELSIEAPIWTKEVQVKIAKALGIKIPKPPPPPPDYDYPVIY
jgi:hypothetical protein